MNFLMTIGMRALGLNKALDAVNGETSKAYLGGLGMILTGAATLLGGAAGLVGQVIPLHAPADYLSFLQGLGTNPNAGLILAGAAVISKGLAAIGQRHALANLQNAAAVPAHEQAVDDSATREAAVQAAMEAARKGPAAS